MLQVELVYNMGLSGGGLTHPIYMLKKGFHKSVQKPQYVIYTFIEYHIPRLYMDTSFFFDLCYFFKYDKFKSLTPKFDLDSIVPLLFKKLSL